MNQQLISQTIWDTKISPLLDELDLDSDQLCELIIELLDQGLEGSHLLEIKDAIDDLYHE